MEFSSLSILVGIQAEKRAPCVKTLMITVVFLSYLVVTWRTARHTRRLLDLKKERKLLQWKTMINHGVQCNARFYCKRQLGWRSLLIVLRVMCKINASVLDNSRKEWKKKKNCSFLISICGVILCPFLVSLRESYPRCLPMALFQISFTCPKCRIGKFSA